MTPIWASMVMPQSQNLSPRIFSKIFWRNGSHQRNRKTNELLRSSNTVGFDLCDVDLYVTDGGLMDKLKDCEKKAIEEVFGRCTECEVMEWINVMQP
jgi:hypothetical protein